MNGKLSNFFCDTGTGSDVVMEVRHEHRVSGELKLESDAERLGRVRNRLGNDIQQLAVAEQELFSRQGNRADLEEVVSDLNHRIAAETSVASSLVAEGAAFPVPAFG